MFYDWLEMNQFNRTMQHMLVFNDWLFIYRAGNEPFANTTEIQQNGVISFRSVTGAEAGAYVCTATNSMGSSTATATLTIRGNIFHYLQIEKRVTKWVYM